MTTIRSLCKCFLYNLVMTEMQLMNSLIGLHVTCYLEVLEYRRLLPLDLLGADALGEVAEQLVRVLLVHPAKLRRPLRYLMK